METLTFKIHGEYITNFLRDLVREGSICKAWRVFTSITEDVGLFNEIIKGKKKFVGVNDLFLEEDNFEFKEENILKTLSMENKDEEILCYKEKLQCALTLESIKLYKYQSKKMKGQSAWITEGGLFLKVENAQHINFLDKIYEKGLIESDNERVMEQRWAKISWSTHGIPLFYATKLTARQKLTLETYFKENNVLKDTIYIHGYGTCEVDGKTYRFYPDKKKLNLEISVS